MGPQLRQLGADALETAQREEDQQEQVYLAEDERSDEDDTLGAVARAAWLVPGSRCVSGGQVSVNVMGGGGSGEW